MSLPADVHRGTSSSSPSWSKNPAASVRNALALPPKWVHMYDDFITKNAGQVSQIESALRSLTYIIPGRFRDAEIASETVHSGVQLLSLYHDTLLLRAISGSKSPASARSPSPHNRYTRFWTQKSALYRRVAMVLQIVQYTELLCEMAAKRRGERIRWRVVMLIEAVKALCRLLLLRITRSRPLVTPALPEREPVPEDVKDADDDDADSGVFLDGDEDSASNGAHGTENHDSATNGHLRSANDKEWTMPRTGMPLPSLPNPADISGYLLSRVLTADDIKPATRLLNSLRGSAQAAEILHILAPLVYVIALARAKNKKSWTPWLIGLSIELAARQLRDRGLRTTALERDEWSKRGWSLGWWTMRGAAYENFTKGLVGGVRRRMPSLVAGILEDYEYLWENYYFSTSS
ncbi:putative peroxisomal membrane protein pex16 protein [Phaeoacremonium minimum UCRPA7]|uniref:Peroxisomal membrane protein PEX16 n=1 Tax=Phaeoacremonium minimum (strain UCR-PA7) TaxID=1286976 RepID=R8B8Z0_PHAM7|nr:putative peroxisomal membrane protein pex16 protein [Phaeoacremonium minimum UCRPA7]EON95766.1 putative peroxisomal membrane protein pex16 protein [Phaeoacremonium minimum UCRPA7]